MSRAIDDLQAARQRAASIRPKVGGFPYVAETLRRAGVTRYRHTVPAATSLFLTDAGPIVTQADPMLDGIAEVAPWNQDALIAALRADQAGQSDYDEFTRACWKAGVVCYEVDLLARTCSYFGATGERYVETYDEVEVRLPF